MMTDSSALCAHQEIWRYGSGVWSIYIIQAHNAFLGKKLTVLRKKTREIAHDQLKVQETQFL